MKYFDLMPADLHAVQPFVLAHEVQDQVVLRPEYNDLRCANCGKLDEELAIDRFISPAVRVETAAARRRDFVPMPYDFTAVSRRFVDFYHSSGMSGLKLYALPGDPDFSLVIAERRPASFDRSTLRIQTPELGAWVGGYVTAECRTRLLEGECRTPGTCEACQRRFVTSGIVASACIDKPSSPLAWFTTSFNHESERGNRFTLYCSELVANLLSESRLRGAQLTELDAPTRSIRLK
jgi:hypothetical protein